MRLRMQQKLEQINGSYLASLGLDTISTMSIWIHFKQWKFEIENIFYVCRFDILLVIPTESVTLSQTDKNKPVS